MQTAAAVAEIGPDIQRIARNGSAQERIALARRPATAPEILYFLAGDHDSEVRTAVAANQATPPQADCRLKQDGADAVRVALAGKLAPAAPQLAASGDKLRRMAFETLSALVRDTAVEVRATIAEALKDVPDAPRDMILELARDVALPVAEPVLRFSPMLTEADLQALVAAPPTAGTLQAIARRPQLAESLSDALVAAGNTQAITALLANSSARIREATLDQLIAQASERQEWHAPLVRRPALPPRAAAQLALIVADTLLREMMARTDLSAATRESLAGAVQKRLAAPAAAAPQTPAEPAAEDAMAEARAMAARGTLTEQALLDAAAQGEVRRVTALLAAAAGVGYAVVERAASLRSAKGLVSLCWKAGFGMQAGTVTQGLLGRISPAKLLVASPAGGFPLAPEEMRWQIDVLVKMGK
ncbi:MAG: DUF2336 domain-containing protein [Acetobacteraceae bacterium]|nr:DUF2336 domain-containing protein [Acetobacteraceae bacterium]